MKWKRYDVTVWRRIVRGRDAGLQAFLLTLAIAGLLIIPDWRRFKVVVPALIICAVAGVIAAYCRGRSRMVSDVVVAEIKQGEKYAAQYCTPEQLQEACEMTREHYGREYVTGDIAEQWRLANPEGFVSITNTAGELCACFGLLGLVSTFQEEFYRGRVCDTELKGRDILPFQATKKCQKLYLSGIVVREPIRTVSSGTRLRVMLWVLLRYYRKCFGLRRKRIVYGLAANSNSESLIEALGFRLACRGDQRNDKCNLYELEVDKSEWDKVSQMAFDFSDVCSTPW